MNHVSSRINGNRSNVDHLIYEQFLCCDISDSSKGVILSDFGCSNDGIWHGRHVLQIEDVINICEACFENKNRDLNKNPKLLKIEMTDGLKKIYAMEYSKIDNLSLNVNVGTKIVLQNPMVKHGICVLTNGNSKILFGGTPLIESENKGKEKEKEKEDGKQKENKNENKNGNKNQVINSRRKNCNQHSNHNCNNNSNDNSNKNDNDNININIDRRNANPSNINNGNAIRNRNDNNSDNNSNNNSNNDGKNNGNNKGNNNGNGMRSGHENNRQERLNHERMNHERSQAEAQRVEAQQAQVQQVQVQVANNRIKVESSQEIGSACQKWVCTTCTFANTMSNSECELCSEKRQLDVCIAPQSSNKSNQIDDGDNLDFNW